MIESRRRRLLFACAAALAGCARDEPRIVERRETRFGRLAVVDLGRRRYLAYGDDPRPMYQSVLDLDRPHRLAARYMRLMTLGLVYAEPNRRVALIGAGAGNLASYLIRNFATVEVDAVDIDAHAVELGRRHFGLRDDPRLRIHIAEGRDWLAASRERFDVVMLDAYDDTAIPAALADEAFFALVAARLAPSGVAMQNAFLRVVDAPRLTAALRASFAQVDAYRVGDSAVLAAYHGPARSAAELLRRAHAIDAHSRPVHALAALLEHRSALPGTAGG